MAASVQSKSSKKPWTPKEDATLLRLIDEYGSCGSWPKIALHMEWRTGKQCRERYINQLDPNIKKTPWTVEEDATILRLHEQMGKKWSKFLDYLPGRSDNAIKNRWHVISRDNLPEQSSPAISTAHIQLVTKQESKNVVKTKKSLKAAVEAAAEAKQVRLDYGKTSSSERLPVCGELENNLECDLLDLDNPNVDFELCSFVAEENGIEGVNFDSEDNYSTNSSSYTARTTNDANIDADGGLYDHEDATKVTFQYTYSKASSIMSSSVRNSPIDPDILDELIHLSDDTPGNSRKPSLQCMTSPSHLSATEDSRSTSTSLESPSPKSFKRNSPKADLNIQTNNSLYDFDFFVAAADASGKIPGNMSGNSSDRSLTSLNSDSSAAGPQGAPQPAPTTGLASSSTDSAAARRLSANREEAIVWSLNPDEDLAQALEFLMSATNSPAHGASGPNTSYGAPSSSGMQGGIRPLLVPRNHSSSLPSSFSSSAGMSLGLSSSSRSPNSSFYGNGNGIGSVAADSPAGARIRPFSGNLASVTALLRRSNSGNCDTDLYPLPGPSAQPSGPFPVPPAGYNFHHNINGASSAGGGEGLRPPPSGFARPEHSPVYHTHFSPACSDSKRPRGKNPSYFHW